MIVRSPLPPGPDTDARRSEMAFVYGPLAASTCFYCGETFDHFPVIEWAGTSLVFLHPDCSQELGARLIKDGLIARESAAAS